jgi:xylulokinase
MVAKLLGIDVGTSSTKAVLIDDQARVLGSAAQDHPTFNPAPGHQEQDPEHWWQGACATIRRVLVETGSRPAEILGIGVSGQGCACLPVDEGGQPLGRALIWTDERATAQKARLREIFGADLGGLTGNDIYDQPEPRMLWIRDNQPERYARTHKFLSTVSFLLFRLSGQMAASISDWGFHLAFDRAAQAWNSRFLDAVGLDGEKFPQLYAPHAVVGGLAEPAARETGLAAGTPVVAGGQDSTVVALAVGVLEAGQSLTMRGTTDLLCFCSRRAAYHPDLYTTPAVLPGLYMSYNMQEVVAAGGSYRWLADVLFGQAGPAQFEAMNHLAEAAPPGAGGLLYLPYLLMATNPDPSLHRAGSFFGLTTATTRGHLCRAVMEGTAYALREAAERMGRAGMHIRELRATGGPTKSALWNQITADVTGLPLLLPAAPQGGTAAPQGGTAADAGAAYGAALLAGLGVGVFPMDDGYQTLRRLIKLEGRFEPQTQTRPTYERMYAAFCRLAGDTAGIGPQLRMPEVKTSG